MMSSTSAREAEHLSFTWLLMLWRSIGKYLRRRGARSGCYPERIIRRGDRLTLTIPTITFTLQVAWLGLRMLSNSVAMGRTLKSPPKAIGSGRRMSFLGCLAYSMHELLLHVPTNAPQSFVFELAQDRPKSSRNRPTLLGILGGNFETGESGVF